MVVNSKKILIFDEICKLDVEKNPSKLIPWYLIASYGYCVKNNPIITDERFDDIALALKNFWNQVDHPYKELLSFEAVSCGTCLLVDYPIAVKEFYENSMKLSEKELKIIYNDFKR